MLNVTRLYILLYKAFFGLVTHPSPLGAFKPNLCLTNLAGERRAEIMPFIDGFLKPNFINKHLSITKYKLIVQTIVLSNIELIHA